MRLKILLHSAPLVAAVVFSAVSLTACAPHRYNVYDATYHDNHRWDSREDAAYRRWESNQNLQHVEYARRNANDQASYWTWRHQHPD